MAANIHHCAILYIGSCIANIHDSVILYIGSCIVQHERTSALYSFIHLVELLLANIPHLLPLLFIGPLPLPANFTTHSIQAFQRFAHCCISGVRSTCKHYSHDASDHLICHTFTQTKFEQLVRVGPLHHHAMFHSLQDSQPTHKIPIISTTKMAMHMNYS